MLQIVMLGEFRVSREGRVLTGLRSPRSQALVGYLVLHRGTPQARQRIANLFWPDSTEPQARTNLRRELHEVRHCLPQPDTVLASDQTTLWWREDAPVEVDAALFEVAADQADAARSAGEQRAFMEHASAAVTAYGGDLLPALYDDWVLLERERLCRRCVTLLDQLVEATGEDDPVAAVPYARQRVDLQPFEEVGHRTLIDVLIRAGDRSAAMQAYHRCISILERELEMPPSPETAALYERLFTPTAGAREPRPAPPDGRTVPFVGREHEMGELGSAWPEAAGGVARLVVISGEAGVGKSRLANELLADVRRSGGAVATARCFAGERPLPLAPVAAWLRSDACRSSVEQLDPVWRTEVARLVPELGLEPAADAPGADRPGDSWQRHRFFEGLVRGVLAVGRPLVLLLDDLQWCDLETLTWLDVCFQLGPAAPLLVVATARAEEIHENPDVMAVLSRLRAGGACIDLELGPLSAAATTELATQLFGTDINAALAAKLQAMTGGFPLFVIEAAQSQRSTAHLDILESPRVQGVLDRRLSGLSPDANQLAEVAGAVGRDFSLDLAAEASDLDLDRAVDALDELWRRRIVREHSAETYDFTHDLLRAVAYERLSPPRRRRAHRRIAQALVLRDTGSGDAVAAPVADHYDRAGMPAHAVPFYCQAVQVADRIYAYQEAVGLAERALSLLPAFSTDREGDVQELALRAAMAGPLNALGGWTSVDARQNAERLSELAERTVHPTILVESLVVRWGMAFVTGRLTEARALADKALEAGGATDAVPLAHLALAGSLTSMGEPVRALQHFKLATTAREGAGLHVMGFPARVMAWAWSAHACWLSGRVGEARERAATAVQMTEDAATPFGRAVAVAYAAITCQLRGDRDETWERAREIQELCDRHHLAYYQHWGKVLEGWLLGGEDGCRLIADGIHRLREHGVGSRLPYYLALQAETLIDSGRAEQAAVVLQEARRAAEAHGDRWWLPELWRLQGRLDPSPRGDGHVKRAVEMAQAHGSASLALRAATDLAARRADRGDVVSEREELVVVRAACTGPSPELDEIDARLASLLKE